MIIAIAILKVFFFFCALSNTMHFIANVANVFLRKTGSANIWGTIIFWTIFFALYQVNV